MGITRQGPVVNMDTDQQLVMLPATKRLTRAALHRILLINEIQHDVSAPFDDLYQTCVRNGIQVVIPPPGPLNSVKGERINRTGGEVVENVDYVKENKMKIDDDGFPRSVFSIRKMCRDRQIPHTKTDSRIMLVDKIIRYVNGQNTT